MCGRDDDAEGVKVTIGKPPCRVCRREPPETNTSMRVRNRRMECRLDSGKGIPTPSASAAVSFCIAHTAVSSSGLAMCSFMPTVLAACTSSAKALAVMATIGTRLQ